MREKHNYIILHDGNKYFVFERMGKGILLDAYNPEKSLGVGDTPEEAIISSRIPRWQIEEKPYEVIFNE